jgi:S-formylglutathione hydrolase FrmB
MKAMKQAVLAAVVAVLASGCGTSDTENSLAAPPIADSPLTLHSDLALSPRLHELSLYSPALEMDTGVRILLPSGYDTSSAQLYPVLYLLHGCCDFDVPGFTAWTTHTDVEAFTEGMPLIIVMPMANRGGFYADWYNNGLYGAPRWETYHIRELLPWIEQNYRVRRDRGGRLLAGLSMGGHGAFTYAAKYPDLFASAAAFSPVLDTNTERGVALVHALEATDLGVPGSVFGQRATEEVRWRGHNPWDLAENLAPIQLFIRTGAGFLDGAPGVPVDPNESSVSEMALNMHNQLDALGIAHFYEDYGIGRHDWPWWQDDLHLILPQQLAHAQTNVTDPEVVTYRSIAPAFSVFGWSVVMQRDAIEFARLGAASSAGFTLSGSGHSVVTTPAFYGAGCSYAMTVDGVATTVNSQINGQLVIDVDLGPSRSEQQYRLAGSAEYLRAVTVKIAGNGC